MSEMGGAGERQGTLPTPPLCTVGCCCLWWPRSINNEWQRPKKNFFCGDLAWLQIMQIWHCASAICSCKPILIWSSLTNTSPNVPLLLQCPGTSTSILRISGLGQPLFPWDPNRYTKLENLAWSQTVFWQFTFCRKLIFMKPLLLSSVVIIIHNTGCLFLTDMIQWF